jgi:DHA2 family multidrug resistance protein
MKAGIGNLPASLSTTVAMFVVGRLLGRVGPRPVVAVGIALLFGSAFASSRWTREADWAQIIFPMMAAGLARGCLFVPMSTTALRSLPVEELPYASGLFNLFRHLGASVSIAALATLLGQWSDVHRVQLAERVGVLDRPVQERVDLLEQMMVNRGVPAEQAEATMFRLMDGTLEQQAWMLSFQDGFALLALLSLLYAPVLPFLRRDLIVSS